MGTIMYGPSVEPDGMELGDYYSDEECPDCQQPGAKFRRWESCHSGAINSHWSVHCPACGYSDADGDDEP